MSKTQWNTEYPKVRGRYLVKWNGLVLFGVWHTRPAEWTVWDADVPRLGRRGHVITERNLPWLEIPE